MFDKNLVMYLDLHGHSVKKNVFSYGPEYHIYSNPHQLFQRGMSLTSMMDQLVDFKAPEIVEAPEDIEIDVVSRRRRVPVLN